MPPNRLYFPMAISSHLWISTNSMKKQAILPLMRHYLKLYTSVAIDDRRIFGRVIGVREECDSYQILTKYGVLDRQYHFRAESPP